MLWNIVSYQMLNNDVLELILDIPAILPYKPGQRALLSYNEPSAPLKRAYSIAEYKIIGDHCQITLAIKLFETSKSSAHLRWFKVWDSVEVGGIFGHFVLHETDNPKIFIWTGTGLVPLIAMANATSGAKKLYFSVSHKSDLFYQDRIQNIVWLQSSIHVSREQVEGCEQGRIDISVESFVPETEFYICWSPTSVTAFAETLKSRWYQNIYTEQY